MAEKNIVDKYMEQRDTKVTLRNIDIKINDLYNLVTNNTVFDARFEGAVVQFHMFLERINNNSLKALIKELHDINFHNYGNQESYVDHLKRIYDKYVLEYEKADKFKAGLTKAENTQKQKMQMFLKKTKQAE